MNLLFYLFIYFFSFGWMLSFSFICKFIFQGGSVHASYLFLFFMKSVFFCTTRFKKDGTLEIFNKTVTVKRAVKQFRLNIEQYM